jgi:hypothetical protein
LDLAAETISLKSGSRLVVTKMGATSWQIGDFVWHYLHAVDNEALRFAVETAASRFFGYLVVPPRHEEILWRACLEVADGRCPEILGLDSLINLRALFTSGDMHWSQQQTILEIFRRYNAKVREAEYDEAILLDIPALP